MKTAKNTYKFSVNIRGYRRQSVVGGGCEEVFTTDFALSDTQATADSCEQGKK